MEFNNLEDKIKEHIRQRALMETNAKGKTLKQKLDSLADFIVEDGNCNKGAVILAMIIKFTNGLMMNNDQRTTALEEFSNLK